MSTCTIENHAVLFALMVKHAVKLCGDDAKDVCVDGITKYGEERGKRMAANAKAHGDELTLLSNQIYGEWKPDFDGQMEFGQSKTEPTLVTYISKCAWCDAWRKHDLMEYGKYYCLTVDDAVYHGFNPDFKCKPISNMSWGEEKCEFDWGFPLTEEDVKKLIEKKKELGTSCMKDFDFHTAHLYHTVGNVIKERLGEKGEEAVSDAVDEYVEMFGQDCFDALKPYLEHPEEF